MLYVPYEEAVHFLEVKLKEAYAAGRIFELKLLNEHIMRQIYEPTITTESLLEYIEKAIEHNKP